MIGNLFLLSEAEYIKYKDIVPTDFAWSWLRTPAGSDGMGKFFVKVVIEDGSIISYWAGDSEYVHICPACYVRNVNQLPFFNRVTKGHFGREPEWIIADKEKGLLISNTSLGTRCFDRFSNQYAGSDVWKFLQSAYMSMSMRDKSNIVNASIEGELSRPLL